MKTPVWSAPCTAVASGPPRRGFISEAERSKGSDAPLQAAHLAVPWRSRAGTSIVELLATMGLVGILAATIYSFTRSCSRSVQAQLARSEAQDVVYLALDWIVRDIRQAGFSSTGAPVVGIVAAQSSRLQLRADFNGDGDFDDTSESVAYAGDAARHTLTRTMGASSPQPVIDHVVPDSLQFAYFDGSGAALSPGASGLDETQRRAVRRVDVAITVEVPVANPELEDAIKIDASASACLRNVPPPQ